MAIFRISRAARKPWTTASGRLSPRKPPPPRAGIDIRRSGGSGNIGAVGPVLSVGPTEQELTCLRGSATTFTELASNSSDRFKAGVVTGREPIALTGNRQKRTGSPATWTVQAPH